MNKASTALSLRRLLLLLVGLLAIVALAFAARDLQRSGVIYREAGRLAERNQIADACLQAAHSFAFERGRSYLVLLAPEPISLESRNFIDVRRATADMRIGEVLARIQGLAREGGGAELAASGEALRAAWLRVSTLRAALERDFARRLPERDPALTDQWIAASNDLVGGLEGLLIGISDFPGEVSAALDRLSTLRILALQFRNLLGAESNLLAGQSLTSKRGFEAISRAKLLRGALLQLWTQLEVKLGRLADPDSSAALATLRVQWVERLRPLQDEIIAAGPGVHSPVVDSQRYLAASLDTLYASGELAEAISEAAAAHTRSRLEQARREALVSLASILAILSLGGLMVMVLVRRFTLPLNAVMGRLDTLLSGPTGIASGVVPKFTGDEFARLAQAVELLDEVLAARARREAALHESERMSASILARAPQSIIVCAGDGLITVFSPGAEKMLGYRAEDMVGKATPLILHDGDEVRTQAKALSQRLGREVSSDMDIFIDMTDAMARAEAEAREWTYVRQDGSRLTVLLAVSALRNAAGEIDGYLGVATDVTERALAVAEISRMAHHDQLTRLPNRRLFHDRMQMAITQARRGETRLALMLIDLDGFKPVNDRLGHPVGDLLLKAVATRMQGCLRESDTLARVGGDEFAVILPRIGQALDALIVAEKIVRALNSPFELSGGGPLLISGSIGVAIYPDHGTDEKHLSKNADQAMYRAKAEGGNGVRLFEPIERGPAEAANGVLLRLVWDQAYQCGEPSIDQGHHELFDRANELIKLIQASPPDVSRLPGLLDQFIACMGKHFASEEALLASRHYAGLTEHGLVHQRLLADTLDLRARVGTGEVAMNELVSFLAQEVVIGHMLEDDLMFFSLLNNHAGHRPAVAASDES